MRWILLLAAVAANGAAAAQIVFLEPREIVSTGFSDLRSACEGRLDPADRTVTFARVALPSERLEDARDALERLAVPDVYVTGHTTLAQAAASARPEVPLVIATLADPADLGLGGVDERRVANVTGFTYFQPFELKHLEIIRALSPEARTIGIVMDRHWAGEALSRRIVAQSQALVGARIATFVVEDAEDLWRLEGDEARGVDAWFVPDTPPSRILGKDIAARLVRWKKPTIGAHGSHLEGGGLAIYEPERIDHWARVCGMLRTILSGTPARDIAFDRPRSFRFVVSAGAARRMGLRIPEAVLKRADRVLP